MSFFQKFARAKIYTREEWKREGGKGDFEDWMIRTMREEMRYNVRGDAVAFHADFIQRGLSSGAIKIEDYKGLEIDDKKIVEYLNKLLKSRNWFVSSYSNHFLFGSRVSFHPIKAESLIVPDKLYHFSKAENKDKILKKGIIPFEGTNHGTAFMYPKRVYVTGEYNVASMRELAEMIYNFGGKTWSSKFVIFEIDSEKLRPGTKFQRDDTIDDVPAFWTYTHIPPEALKVKYEGS